MLRKFAFVLLLSAAASVSAQDWLLIGTGDFDAGIPDNDVFRVDLPSGSATNLGSFDVWGATWNGTDSVYISSVDGTSGSGIGDNLWKLDTASGAVTQLGVVTGPAGDAVRLDGLAYSNGTLYGWNQFDTAANLAGLYSIDMTSLVATQQLVDTTGNGISGIDADPASGLIYGLDDASGQIVSIDPSTGISALAAYNVGTDVDGLAAGPGTLYLVQDEPNAIEVFDIATLTYTSTIASPFSVADTFSGAAYVQVPEPGAASLMLLGLLAFVRRRR